MTLSVKLMLVQLLRQKKPSDPTLQCLRRFDLIWVAAHRAPQIDVYTLEPRRCFVLGSGCPIQTVAL